jgi:hypothetical protein
VSLGEFSILTVKGGGAVEGNLPALLKEILIEIFTMISYTEGFV